MGDMFLILAASRGFSMAANPMMSFALTPDRPWLPWQRKFENFNRKFAITGLRQEIMFLIPGNATSRRLHCEL